MQQTLLTDEEKTNLNLLKIKNNGLLFGVTDKNRLVGILVIPDSVTGIGVRAFCDCSGITQVVIPDSVTKIAALAFSGCTGLTDIVIPNSITKIDRGAFSGINPDAHFTVRSEAVKQLLLDSESGIRDEQITVEQNL